MSTQAWAAGVYAHDKQVAALCRQAQINGFAFDSVRGAELAAYLHNIEKSAGEKITQACGYAINPLSPNQLQWAFFERMGAPIYFRSKITRRPVLNVDAMRGYAACADEDLRSAALSVLEFRRARKLRRTYIERLAVGADNRVHPTWLNYGTVSGRWSSQKPNMQNLPTPGRDPTQELGGIRSLYHAPEGCQLVYYDFSQLEMRIAAYASGDLNMISACEGSDLHAANAELVFGGQFSAAEYARLKQAHELTPEDAKKLALLTHLRQIAKSAGFAICYGADASTVYARIIAEGVNISLRQVEGMLNKLKSAFRTYYRWQACKLLDCIKHGWVESPLLGRRRYLGHEPRPTEVMNFPIQSGAADVSNNKLLAIAEDVKSLRAPAVQPVKGRNVISAAPTTVKLVAQVHDSGTLEVPESLVDKVLEMVKLRTSEPVTFKTALDGVERSAVFPSDNEVMQRWH